MSTHDHQLNTIYMETGIPCNPVFLNDQVGYCNTHFERSAEGARGAQKSDPGGR